MKYEDYKDYYKASKEKLDEHLDSIEKVVDDIHQSIYDDKDFNAEDRTRVLDKMTNIIEDFKEHIKRKYKNGYN